MKRILLSLILLASVLRVPFAQPKNGTALTKDAILKLEQRWEEAVTKSDIAALDKLYDPTLVYTHSNGKVDSKASFMRMIQSGATQYQSMKRDDINVTVYRGSAVVTCHWVVHVLAQGNQVDLNARYLHVYVQRPDGCRLVAHESTRIAP
jgi:ketosteroid isomerase-like protein